MPAKPLNEEQLEDARRLREAFAAAKLRDPSLTQEKVAFICGWKTQGTVHQYLKGKIPLNLSALMKFSKVLNIDPDEISPSLVRELGDAGAFLVKSGDEIAVLEMEAGPTVTNVRTLENGESLIWIPPYEDHNGRFRAGHFRQAPRRTHRKDEPVMVQDPAVGSGTFLTRAIEHASNFEAGPDINKIKTYPLISFVQAGSWTEISDNFQPGDAESWMPCHRDLGPHGYVLRVRGPSMTAPPGDSYTFPDGILIFVNPSMEAVPGQFVIARRNKAREATFKKYIVVDGEPYLEALNPNWPERYIKLEEGDQICGVVRHAGFDMP